MLNLFLVHTQERRLVAAVLFFALLTIVACSGASSPVAEADDKTPGQSYDSFSDLPECTSKLEGNKAYVEETAYKCEDGEWVKTKESGKKESSDEDDDDDGEGGEREDDDDSGSSSSGESSGQSGRVVIDESKSIIKPYIEKSVEGCFMNGLDVSWKTVDFGIDQSSFKYEFVGDTLVLYRGTAFSEYGTMYVGGSGGNLNGTWQSTLCYFDHYEEETTCYKLCSEVKAKLLKTYGVSSEVELDEEDLEDFNEEYYEKRGSCIDEDEITDVTIKISGDDISIIEKYRETEDENFTDYMNSEYIAELYEAIYQGSRYAPSIFGITDEDSADVKKYRGKADIEEKSRTKTSLTFVVDEETEVSVAVSKLKVDMDRGKGEINMTVSSGKRTCELDYMSGRVNRGDCNGDNLGVFDEPTKIEAEDGTVYKQVSYMEDSNRDDFDACVGNILKDLAESSESADDEDEYCASVREAYESCLNEYVDYYDASDAREICSSYYDIDYYCGGNSNDVDYYSEGGSFAKTAASTTKLSKSKFKQLQRAHVNALEMFLK